VRIEKVQPTAAFRIDVDELSALAAFGSMVRATEEPLLKQLLYVTIQDRLYHHLQHNLIRCSAFRTPIACALLPYGIVVRLLLILIFQKVSYYFMLFCNLCTIQNNKIPSESHTIHSKIRLSTVGYLSLRLSPFNGVFD